MNKALNFKFQRIDDFELPGYPENELLYFPFLIYDDTDMKNHFCLISNHHPQGKLIPALRQVDYFLMAQNSLDDSARTSLVSKIRKISQVLAAYEIDPVGTKDMSLLLEEMELHLLISEKKKKAIRA